MIKVEKLILKYFIDYKAILIFMVMVFIYSFINRNRTVDFQIHDTYYVIAYFHIGSVVLIFLGILGFIYWASRKIKLVLWMKYAHILLTVGIITFLMIKLLNVDFNKGLNDFKTYEISQSFNFSIFILTCLLALTQIVLLLNIIISLRKNKNHS